MKKLLSLLTALCILFACSTAFAAGKISIEEENFIVIKDYSLYGYAYAKVKNVGNKPIKLHAGIMEVFDSNGDTITSTDSFYNVYGKYLEPDQYTYVRMYTGLEDVTADDVDDYMLTLTGKTDNSYEDIRLSCTAEYAQNVKDGYYTHDYVYVTVTNDLDVPAYNVTAIIALLDEDNNIWYVANDYLDSNIAIISGDSVIIRFTIDSDWIDYFDAHDITITSVDAIAYTEVKKNE